MCAESCVLYQDGRVEGHALMLSVRTPKLQLAAGQLSREECWIPPKKIPHAQEQMRSPSKTVGGAISHLESNPILARDTQRAQTNFVCTRT